MLEAVKFKVPYRCFSQGEQFLFQPGLNVIVGENGAGKSTLLELIAKNKEDILYLHASKRTKSYYLDLETNKPLVNSISRIPEESIVLIDEPDMALSIKSIVELYKLLSKESETKQIICSAHNPLLIELAEKVLVIDGDGWCNSYKYVQSQLHRG